MAPAKSGCTTRPAPSDGLQVTERTGWQKDNGEPDVSPDGRYLYYSKDVTPGQTFEYNKDPERHDLRRDAPRSDDRPRAARGQRAGRIGRARRCRPTGRRSPTSGACG